MREARIETAERSGVVVDLRDSDVARLELLNDALNPLFDEVPNDVDLFDRGVSKGDIPRLWIDVVAHVEMGRDKRQYRFVQDTRYGRAVLAESYEVPAMADAIKRYIARRLVEREHGVGTALVKRALQEAKKCGHKLVVLVGDEPIYAKSGFRRIPKGQVKMPGPVDPARLLVAELAAGAFDGVAGLMRPDWETA